MKLRDHFINGVAAVRAFGAGNVGHSVQKRHSHKALWLIPQRPGCA